jgi:hypothetical protein
MLEQFGDDYREYMERTGRLSPDDPKPPGRTEETALRISRLLAPFAFAHRYLLRHSARMRTLPP